MQVRSGVEVPCLRVTNTLIQMTHAAAVRRLKRSRDTDLDDFSSGDEAQVDSEEEDFRSDIEDNQSDALDTLERLDGDLAVDDSDLSMDQEWIMLSDGTAPPQAASARVHASQSAAMAAQYVQPFGLASSYARFLEPREAWYPPAASCTTALALAHPSSGKWFRSTPSSR